MSGGFGFPSLLIGGGSDFAAHPLRANEPGFCDRLFSNHGNSGAGLQITFVDRVHKINHSGRPENSVTRRHTEDFEPV